jgi:hypothetical protein
VVSPEDLRPVRTIAADVLVAVAARVGPTRLIDNTILRLGAWAQTRPPGAGEAAPAALAG